MGSLSFDPIGLVFWFFGDDDGVSFLAPVFDLFYSLSLALRILGPSNGGVWTRIAGVFWGPQNSHFWGVRILRVACLKRSLLGLNSTWEIGFVGTLSGAAVHQKTTWWDSHDGSMGRLYIYQVIQAVTFSSPSWRSRFAFPKGHFTIPKRSQRTARYLFIYIYVHANAGKYTIHRSYGIGMFCCIFVWNNES